MWSMNRKTKMYLIIAFAWTWIGWGGAYMLSERAGLVLSTESTLLTLFTKFLGTEAFAPQLIFALAVYGPFVGFLTVSGFRSLNGRADKRRNLWPYVFLIPVISVLPAVILSLFTSFYDLKGQSIGTAFSAVWMYFLFNIITSGTEEFGWRGFLYPEMKAEGMSFWDIAWKGGFVWALWHFPLLFILYLPAGAAVLIPSLIGFTASIVAMNYITNFLYEAMDSILAVILLHGMNNTMSFLLVLLFPGTPFTLLTSLMAWAFVWWIEKKHGDLIQAVNGKAGS
ncbi:CPBP family intramembrane glutamic endopeptidase [Proteiniclasticum sp. C24MP]|uniref:CPBP family intramembrane glutamic endopeptidase n=1 Tax=Proteiniclasticum sp. C24MP TaxID=3374101 RepID=UPI003753F561